MNDKFTAEDFQNLTQAYGRIQDLKKFVIARGEIFYRMNGKPLNLRYDDGHRVVVTDYDLFTKDAEDITFTQEDTRAGYQVAAYKVPRAFVFATEKTEQEQKWEQYLALKAELEPAHVAATPVPRQKAPGIIRKKEDVTGCYWECYGIYCDKDATAGETFCKDHRNQKCRLCGKPATHGCNMELQFVCGEPLCPDHRVGIH